MMKLSGLETGKTLSTEAICPLAAKDTIDGDTLLEAKRIKVYRVVQDFDDEG